MESLFSKSWQEKRAERNSETSGRLDDLISLLQDAWIAAGRPDGLSASDIESICYGVNPDKYADCPVSAFLMIMFIQLEFIYRDCVFSDSVMSVDGAEYIFLGSPDKKAAVGRVLDVLRMELTSPDKR